MRPRLREPLGQPFVDAVLRPRLLADVERALPAMLAVNRAHLVMLHQRGLLTAEAAALLARALDHLEREGFAPADLDPGLEDLYANLEGAVSRAAGEDAAGRLHLGRSRNDLWATVARMTAREALDRITARLLGLRARLLDLATEYADLVIPGYTHLQPAQPITAGFYFLGVEQALGRDWERLRDAFPRVNRCPLGAAALAGTSFPIDRDLTARLLGFSEPLANALDAVASRDYVLEILSALALLGLTLSRLAEDLYFWSSAHVGFLDVSGAIAIASSIMPQKKNAAALEHLKGRAAEVVGTLVAALAATKGTHFMHSRDTSVEVTLHLAAGEQALGVVLQLALAALDGIAFRPQVAARLAAGDFSTVTDLAETLVREADLPFRVAHEVCATLVREALDAGRGLEALDAATVNAAASARSGRPVRLTEAAVRAALDPVASVGRRQAPGGTAPGAVREAIVRARARLDEDRQQLDARRAALDAAARELHRRAAELAAGDTP